ncbi:LacI family transcriptional regulator [Capsulimonas corticalis]|uniref:LacI family transcriptional regulator n=1 Tax=Capsulimonas corticalis TaxID=2219043 RepID=A0A402CQX5_9BACT|nr:substrate-binding domain-containing protein [Capsulimonas corticalis]BDI34510.1 LacI family transcriptional regulator [Capsulimonas corticalis]
MMHSNLTTIGVIVSHYDSAFLSEFLEALAGVCRSESLGMRVYRTQQGDRAADTLRHLERSPDEERIIILGQPQQNARELAASLAIKTYRSLTIDTLVPGASNSYVGTDNALGVRIGMDHLMALGHRRILLLINEPLEAETVRARLREFKAVVAEHGLTGCGEFYCGTQFWDHSSEIVYRRMPEIWPQDVPFTAIFTTSDAGAWAALQWFSEHGVPVPDRVSVLGFDDDAPSRTTTPPLSTVGHRVAEMARQAVSILMGDTPVTVLTPPDLVVRQSTGPPYLFPDASPLSVKNL